jgi:hypothetical protein
MSTTPVTPTGPPSLVVCPGVVLANHEVSLEGLNPVLRQFLAALGPIHEGLFGTVATVTSGVDKIHVASSKHYKGDAVDLRINDKAGREQLTFTIILIELSGRYRLAVFDESFLPGQAHIHVEVAG